MDGRTHSTAPGMPPLKKVKARNCNTISAEDAENMFKHNSCPTKSKVNIPLIHLPDSPCVQPATEGFKLNISNGAQEMDQNKFRY